MSADASIEAVYLNDKAKSENVITIFAKQIDSTRAGFYTEYDIDEKYTVIESGILMGPSDDLTFDSAPVKAAAQSKQNKGQFTVRKDFLWAIRIMQKAMLSTPTAKTPTPSIRPLPPARLAKKPSLY